MEIAGVHEVKGEFNPQAIEDYYYLDKSDDQYNKKGVRDIQLKAKQHLSAVGWSFHYVLKKDKKGLKRELRYCPPKGRKYISLKTACKAYLDQRTSVLKKNGGDFLGRRNMEGKERGYLFGGQVVEVGAEKKMGSFGSVLGECIHGNLDEKKGSVLDSISFDGENQGVTKVGVDVNINGATMGDMQGNLGENERIVPDSNKSANQFKGRGAKKNGKKRQINGDSLSDHDFQSCKRVRVASENKRAKPMLSWLIEHKAILPLAKVHYRNKKDGRSMAEGRVTSEGIRCICCDQVFTISKFEAHAGSNYHRPAANIFLEDGRTLSQCQEQLKGDSNLMARNLRENLNLNDEICSVCRFGGELVLCDQCPSAFHTMCLGMQAVPDSEFWYCTSCCCRICRQNISISDKENVKKCDQCELQYHVKCLKQSYAAEVNKRNWFCTKKCEDISVGLHKLLGKPFLVGENNLTCTLLKNENNVGDHVENHSKLHDALGVMRECFEPVKEPWSGRDVIEDVIFSRESEVKRLNFRGFYTMILERDGVVITVATVRIFGVRVAEVPFVATRFRYQRSGMCKIIMHELEKKLMEIGVEMLVLPSVPCVLSTWTSPSFGFSRMTDSDRLRFLNYTLLDFPNSMMCQKLLMKNRTLSMK